MKILSAEFVTSAAAGGRADGVPRDGRPQIALAGRSNVGKSSLLNALCRKTIARTSAAPGKTRLANIYRVTLEGGGGPGRWDLFLVDLPGYGYARGGEDSAAELQAVAEAYFMRERLRPARGAKSPSAEKSGPAARAPGPAGVLLLVDSRHPGLAADLQAFAWLQRMGASPHVVATKVDKLSRAERTRNLRELERVFEVAVLPVSVTTGEGLDDLWRLIAGHRTQKNTDQNNTDSGNKTEETR